MSCWSRQIRAPKLWGAVSGAVFLKLGRTLRLSVVLFEKYTILCPSPHPHWMRLFDWGTHMWLQLKSSPRWCWRPADLWLLPGNRMPHQPWEEEGSHGLRTVALGTWKVQRKLLIMHTGVDKWATQGIFNLFFSLIVHWSYAHSCQKPISVHCLTAY